ncbi:hypothetical protein BDV93DRAFT_53388 [Ceratobasidium sp. AG-I]|nr:hypothetical protein BDV93DRAFT_53388 [Ceratobasidium sp. AG-I]
MRQKTVKVHRRKPPRRKHCSVTEPLRVANVRRVVPTMTGRRQALLRFPIVAVPPPTGWPGSHAGSGTGSRDSSRASSPAGSHDGPRASPRAGPRAHSNASPAKHSSPPSSTHQANKSAIQGGAGSNREYGGCNEAEDAPIPGSRQNDAGRNAREEDEEAPVASRRTGLRARAGLAAALAAADGAAEEDDTAHKSSGGSKKGGKAKAKPKPKKGKGEGEELFPDEGGEEDGDE